MYSVKILKTVFVFLPVLQLPIVSISYYNAQQDCAIDLVRDRARQCLFIVRPAALPKQCSLVFHSALFWSPCLFKIIYYYLYASADINEL